MITAPSAAHRAPSSPAWRADGASRAKMGVFAALLGRLGLLDAAATAALVDAVEGDIADSNGKPVGRIAVTLPA
jgi:L-asparaginase II